MACQSIKISLHAVGNSEAFLSCGLYAGGVGGFTDCVRLLHPLLPVGEAGSSLISARQTRGTAALPPGSASVSPAPKVRVFITTTGCAGFLVRMHISDKLFRAYSDLKIVTLSVILF